MPICNYGIRFLLDKMCIAGEEDGYCIPEISLCPDLQMLLRDENFTKLKADVDLGNRNLPPYLMRLVKDAYVCFYENRMIPN